MFNSLQIPTILRKYSLWRFCVCPSVCNVCISQMHIRALLVSVQCAFVYVAKYWRSKLNIVILELSHPVIGDISVWANLNSTHNRVAEFFHSPNFNFTNTHIQLLVWRLIGHHNNAKNATSQSISNFSVRLQIITEKIGMYQQCVRLQNVKWSNWTLTKSLDLTSASIGFNFKDRRATSGSDPLQWLNFFSNMCDDGFDHCILKVWGRPAKAWRQL